MSGEAPESSDDTGLGGETKRSGRTVTGGSQTLRDRREEGRTVYEEGEELCERGGTEGPLRVRRRFQVGSRRGVLLKGPPN